MSYTYPDCLTRPLAIQQNNSIAPRGILVYPVYFYSWIASILSFHFAYSCDKTITHHVLCRDLLTVPTLILSAPHVDSIFGLFLDRLYTYFQSSHYAHLFCYRYSKLFETSQYFSLFLLSTLYLLWEFPILSHTQSFTIATFPIPKPIIYLLL